VIDLQRIRDRPSFKRRSSSDAETLPVQGEWPLTGPEEQPLFLPHSPNRQEVAIAFGLPVTTVANRKKDIVKRLGAKTIFEAGQKARALGFLR